MTVHPHERTSRLFPGPRCTSSTAHGPTAWPSPFRHGPVCELRRCPQKAQNSSMCRSRRRRRSLGVICSALSAIHTSYANDYGTDNSGSTRQPRTNAPDPSPRTHARTPDKPTPHARTPCRPNAWPAAHCQSFRNHSKGDRFRKARHGANASIAFPQAPVARPHRPPHAAYVHGFAPSPLA
jgi:hypothetical protein